MVLIALVAVLGLELGSRLGPGASDAQVKGQDAGCRMRDAESRSKKARQPDWGGGRLVTGGKRRPAGGVELRRIGTPPEIAGRGQSPALEAPQPGTVPAISVMSQQDYSLSLAVSGTSEPGRAGLFEVASTARFRKELLPGTQEADAPAEDIPLYPGAGCRTQVGRGTACFVGFYLTPDSVEAVRSFYVQSLGRLGWDRMTPGSRGVVETFAKPEQARTVVVQLRRQDQCLTRIGLVAMEERR
jgi:hypothetical protein